jgi:CRP-like cAMP-binding protein
LSSNESEKSLIEKMRSVSLFSGLKEKQLKAILGSGRKLSYPADNTIASEGKNGVAFFLILDGKVEVRLKGKVLARMSSGDFFGEMSLLDQRPRSSDVVTVTPTTCLVLTSWSFTSLVKTNNDIAVNLIKTLVQRLRESNKALTE